MFLIDNNSMKSKKVFAIAFSVFVALSSNAQIDSGFNALEAKNMIQICNSFSYMDLYNSDATIIPSGFDKSYASPSYGMDNMFQIYKNENKAVINFRGTTANQLSWMENLYASMIPVKGKIIVNGDPFPYQLGENKSSHIHAGYTLAIYYFKDDLLKQIKKLNDEGIYNIFITGHSQGAALAQLVRAYLDYLPKNVLSKKNTFKVYAFASPMIGNKSFIEEYDRKYCTTGMSYLINNPEDYITRLPFSYNDSTFWQENISTLVTNRSEFSTKNAAIEGFSSLFKDKLINMAKNMSKNIETQIFKELGDIEMPEFYEDLNYSATGNLIKLSPTEYPLELKDPTILKNDSLMKVLKRDNEGYFEDKSLYKKQGFSLQHKPYNYYTSVLKDYFPEEYARLDQKYFVLPNK